MKKLKSVLGVILTAVMLFQMFPVAFAASDSVTVGTTVRVRKYDSSVSDDNYTDNYDVRNLTKNGSEAFDFMASIDMTNVWNTFKKWNSQMKTVIDSIAPTGEKEMMLEELKATKITGKFTIETEIDKDIEASSSDKDKLGTLIEFVADEQGNNIDDNMYGFNAESKRHFIATERTYTPGEPHKLKITVKPWNVAENRELTIGDLEKAYSMGDEWGDLAFQARNCTVNGTYGDGPKTVSMKASGNTTSVFKYGENTKSLYVSYTFNDADQLTGGVDNPYSDKDNSASILFPETAPSKPSTGGSSTVKYKLTFDIDGDTNVVPSITRNRNTSITLADSTIPYKDGYTFDGWYFDEAKTDKIDAKFTLTKDTTVYGTWVKNDIDGDDTGSKLNTGDHFAYVVGYPDGNVRPEQNISREEIGVIFFRLMTDEYRNEILTKSNSFDDVEKSRWSNTGISTMAKGGYIVGYEDGSFKPEKYITRAEFAAIAARFDSETPVSATHSFTDIDGHWAENDIARAVKRGWITGYEDGTFRPDQNITRAEAMTIINRMLNRFVNEEGLHKAAILWPDNDKNAWYYYAVEEATNSHDYVRQADGVYEKWTAINPVRDWTEFE